MLMVIGIVPKCVHDSIKDYQRSSSPHVDPCSNMDLCQVHRPITVPPFQAVPIPVSHAALCFLAPGFLAILFPAFTFGRNKDTDLGE